MAHREVEERLLALAGEVAPLASLLSVRLRSMDANVLDAGEDELASDPSSSHPFYLPLSQEWWSKDSNFVVDISLVFDGLPPSQGDHRDRVRIRAQFRLIYRLTNNGSIERDKLDAFASVNSIYNVWPYWREVLQSQLVRMGFPAFTVPLLNAGAASSLARQLQERRESQINGNQISEEGGQP